MSRRILIVNPTARFTSVTVEIAHRRKGRRYHTIYDPRAVAFLLDAGRLRSLDAAKEPGVARSLKDADVLIAPRDVPRAVPFPCRIEDAGRLVPYRDRPDDDAGVPASRLVVSPFATVCSPGETPEGLSVPREFLAVVAAVARRRLLWTRDPVTGLWACFTLEGRLGAVAERLVNGRLAPARLAPSLVDLLRRAQVLVPRDAERPRRGPDRGLPERLAADQYVVLRGLVNPVFLGALRRYYRAMEREGQMSWGDEFVPLRMVAHNDQASRLLHFQLAELMSEVTGEPLKASYSFLAVYLPKATLPRHVDREQCAWNLSLVMDAAPETEPRRAWPIYVEVAGRRRRVRLGMGDGVLYRGTELPHWRNAQPEDRRTTVCFFHFVGRDFEGGLS